MVPRGAWSALASYAALDIVSHDGGSFLAVQDVPPGTLTSDEAYWQAVADRGDPGPAGDAGPAGDPGPGVPVGGAMGQVLAKTSATDFATGWVDPANPVDSLVKLPAGLFTCAMTSGAALGTVAQVANRNTVAPFRPQFSMSVDQVGVSTSTGVAASTAKVVIYAADPATNLPSTLIAESANISCATSGTTVFASLSVSFEAGKTYWIGARASATQTLRSITSGGLPMLALTNAGTPVIQGSLVKLETYATPAAAWGFLNAHLSNITVPLVLMRVA
jgi:hypothetical protein